MSGKRFRKIVLPLFLLAIIGSVTSCFMFFMDWSEEETIVGDWIYTDTAINEVVTLTITKDTIEMVFDEDNPYYPRLPNLYIIPAIYFNDWGFRGILSVNEDTMNISINELYRFYSKWYQYYLAYAPYWYSINRERTGGGWYTSIVWPWDSPTYPINFWYSNFLNNFPGSNLGANVKIITSVYTLDGDRLTLTFDPGGLNATYEFQRK